MGTDDAAAGLLGAATQVLLVLFSAPLLLGITKRVKARLQYRRGPALLQPYYDLAKWWRKESVESDAATALSQMAPAVVLAAVLVACLLVPIVATRPPLGTSGDLFVVIGLLALSRFVLALGALDAGSAFGGMGSSREVAISTLVEPALLLGLAAAAVAAGSSDLGVIATSGAAAGMAWWKPELLLGAAAFAIVAVAETGHEPVDNPDTHLELTMVAEGMLLESSGRRLAILTYAMELRFVVVAGLFAAAFLPAGVTDRLGPDALLIGAAIALVKLVGAAVAVGVLDATLAKVRILALPGLLASGTILALIGLSAHIWLPA